MIADEMAIGFWQARRRASTGATPSLLGPAASPWRRTWALGEGKRPTGGPRPWPQR